MEPFTTVPLRRPDSSPVWAEKAKITAYQAAAGRKLSAFSRPVRAGAVHLDKFIGGARSYFPWSRFASTWAHSARVRVLSSIRLPLWSPLKRTAVTPFWAQ